MMKLSNQSKLPKQVAPVQRLSTTSAMSNQYGVDASGIASNLWNILKIYGN
ncbi:MAG TPA: hypothetical protein VK203_02355 [Nostocaceae cyanobacterium]|nr:hypothetical protein [Nostocaceae cyanobacterium]